MQAKQKKMKPSLNMAHNQVFMKDDKLTDNILIKHNQSFGKEDVRVKRTVAEKRSLEDGKKGRDLVI